MVKLGVNRLEARIPSANPIIESSSGILYPFVIPILKPQRSRFHPKQNTVIIIKYRFIYYSNLLQSPSEEYIFIY
jgi:hypothetical protein